MKTELCLGKIRSSSYRCGVSSYLIQHPDRKTQVIQL